MEAEVIRDNLCQVMLIPETLVQIEAFCDSKNALQNLESLTMDDKKMPIRKYIKGIKNMMDEGRVKKLGQITTKEQLADSLSKLTSTPQDLINTIKQGIFFI